MKNVHFFLLVAAFLAFLLRFFALGRVPASLSWDEVAIGYNAYSILNTGRDEYGQKFPILFRSFDDYKLPGYIYLTTPSIAIFGLNEFAVRFPSAFFGTLAVLLTYFLVNELFINGLKRENKLVNPASPAGGSLTRNKLIALTASFLLAMSPWHIHFSRAAFEANVCQSFFLLGLLLLLKGLKKDKFLFLGTTAWALSLYFYYSVRILVPILLFSFFFLYQKKFKKQFLVLSSLFLVLLLPLFGGILSQEAAGRVSQVSIFKENPLALSFISQAQKQRNFPLFRFFYNKHLACLFTFLDNYFKNLSLDFLFTTGDPYPRHRIWGMGVMYLWEFPFFLLGLFKILKMEDKIKWLILVWFFSAPIPASLSVGAPHALRTLCLLPLPQIFVSLGLFEIFVWLKGRRKSLLLPLGLLAGLAFYFFVFFLLVYFDFTPKKEPLAWGNGHKELVGFLKTVESQYDRIVVTGEYFKPYIYFLFYLPKDPIEFQTRRNSLGFGKYQFGIASWEKKGVYLGEADLAKLISGRTLFVLTPKEFVLQKERVELEVIKEIYSYEQKVFIVVRLV